MSFAVRGLRRIPCVALSWQSVARTSPSPSPLPAGGSWLRQRSCCRYFRITPDLATTGEVQITVKDNQGETKVYGSYTNPNPDSTDFDFEFLLTSGPGGRTHTATLAQDSVCSPTVIPFSSLSGNAKRAADTFLNGGIDGVCTSLDDTRQPPCGAGVGCIACAAQQTVVCSKCAPVFFSVEGASGSTIEFGVSGSTTTTTRGTFGCSFRSNCPPQVTDTTSTCPNLFADVGLLVDTSGSLDKPSFDAVMEGLKSMSSRFVDVGPSTTRFGWGQFLDEGVFVVNQNMQQAFSKGTSQCAMEDTPFRRTASLSSTSKTLGDFAELLFDPTGSSFRPAVPRILVIVTDAESKTPSALQNSAAALKTHNVQVHVLGVNSFSQSRIESIAGDAPTYTAGTTNVLPEAFGAIGNALCKTAVGLTVADLQGQALAAVGIPARQVNYYQIQPLPFAIGTTTVTVVDLTGSTVVYGSYTDQNPSAASNDFVLDSQEKQFSFSSSSLCRNGGVSFAALGRTSATCATTDASGLPACGLNAEGGSNPCCACQDAEVLACRSCGSVFFAVEGQATVSITATGGAAQAATQPCSVLLCPTGPAGLTLAEMIGLAIGATLGFLLVLGAAMYVSALGPLATPLAAYGSVLISPVGMCLAGAALAGLVAFACTVGRDNGGTPLRRRSNGVILPALAFSTYPNFFAAMCFLAFLWTLLVLIFLICKRRGGDGRAVSGAPYTALAIWLALWCLLLIIAAGLWTGDVVAASAVHSPVSVLGTHNLYAGLFFGWLTVALMLLIINILGKLGRAQKGTTHAQESVSMAAVPANSRSGGVGGTADKQSSLVVNPMFQAPDTEEFVIDDNGFGAVDGVEYEELPPPVPDSSRPSERAAAAAPDVSNPMYYVNEEPLMYEAMAPAASTQAAVAVSYEPVGMDEPAPLPTYDTLKPETRVAAKRPGSMCVSRHVRYSLSLSIPPSPPLSPSLAPSPLSFSVQAI